MAIVSGKDFLNQLAYMGREIIDCRGFAPLDKSRLTSDENIFDYVINERLSEARKTHGVRVLIRAEAKTSRISQRLMDKLWTLQSEEFHRHRFVGIWGDRLIWPRAQLNNPMPAYPYVFEGTLSDAAEGIDPFEFCMGDLSPGGSKGYTTAYRRRHYCLYKFEAVDAFLSINRITPTPFIVEGKIKRLSDEDVQRMLPGLIQSGLDNFCFFDKDLKLKGLSEWCDRIDRVAEAVREEDRDLT